jgi:hypothetical protein
LFEDLEFEMKLGRTVVVIDPQSPVHLRQGGKQGAIDQL